MWREPGIRQQVGDSIGRIAGELYQRIPHVGQRFNLIRLCTRHDAVKDRYLLTAVPMLARYASAVNSDDRYWPYVLFPSAAASRSSCSASMYPIRQAISSGQATLSPCRCSSTQT